MMKHNVSCKCAGVHNELCVGTCQPTFLLTDRIVRASGLLSCAGSMDQLLIACKACRVGRCWRQYVVPDRRLARSRAGMGLHVLLSCFLASCSTCCSAAACRKLLHSGVCCMLPASSLARAEQLPRCSFSPNAANFTALIIAASLLDMVEAHMTAANMI